MSAVQQENHFTIACREVHAVPLADAEAHLANIAANRFPVTQVAKTYTVDAGQYRAFGLMITQASERLLEIFRDAYRVSH